VFTSSTGTRIRGLSTRHWRTIVARAGLAPDVTWHVLRHTSASWHVQSGTTLQELKELGGWATMAMVERYAHLARAHLANTAERIVQPAPEVRRFGLANAKAREDDQ
jgi:site-specific recombinase XerD